MIDAIVSFFDFTILTVRIIVGIGVGMILVGGVGLLGFFIDVGE